MKTFYVIQLVIGIDEDNFPVYHPNYGLAVSLAVAEDIYAWCGMADWMMNGYEPWLYQEPDADSLGEILEPDDDDPGQPGLLVLGTRLFYN